MEDLNEDTANISLCAELDINMGDVDVIFNTNIISANVIDNDQSAPTNKESYIVDIVRMINMLDDTCLVVEQKNSIADKLHKMIANIYNICDGFDTLFAADTSFAADNNLEADDRVYHFLYDKLIYAINSPAESNGVSFDKLSEQTCGAIIKYLIIMLYNNLTSEFMGGVNNHFKVLFHKYIIIYIKNSNRSNKSNKSNKSARLNEGEVAVEVAVDIAEEECSRELWNIYNICDIINTIYVAHKSLTVQSLCNYFANRYGLNQSLPHIDLLQIIRFTDVVEYFDSLYIDNVNKSYFAGAASIPLAANFYKSTEPNIGCLSNSNMSGNNSAAAIDIIVAAGSSFKEYLRALNISNIVLNEPLLARLFDEFSGFSTIGELAVDININYLVNDLKHVVRSNIDSYSRESVLECIKIFKSCRESLITMIMSKYDIEFFNRMFLVNKHIIISVIYQKQDIIPYMTKLYLSLVYDNRGVRINFYDAVWLLLTSDISRFNHYVDLLDVYTAILKNSYYEGDSFRCTEFHIILSILYDTYISQRADVPDPIKDAQVDPYHFYSSIESPALHGWHVNDVRRSLEFRRVYHSKLDWNEYKKIYSYIKALVPKVVLSTSNPDVNDIIYAISTLNPDILYNELKSYYARLFDAHLNQMEINSKLTVNNQNAAWGSLAAIYIKVLINVIKYIASVVISDVVSDDIWEILRNEYFNNIHKNISGYTDILSEELRLIISSNPIIYSTASCIFNNMNDLIFSRSLVNQKKQILVNKICARIISEPIPGVSIAQQLEYYNTITISMNDIYYALFNIKTDAKPNREGIVTKPRHFDHLIEYIELLVTYSLYSINSPKPMEYIRRSDGKPGSDSLVVGHIIGLLVERYTYNIIDLFDKFNRECPAMKKVTFSWKMGTFIEAAKGINSLNQFADMVRVIKGGQSRAQVGVNEDANNKRENRGYIFVVHQEHNKHITSQLESRVRSLGLEHKILFISLYCLIGDGCYTEQVYNFLYFIITHYVGNRDIYEYMGKGKSMCLYLTKLAASDSDELNTNITRLLYMSLDRGDIGIITYLMNNIITRSIIYMHIGYVIRDISYWAKSRRSIELFICILSALDLLSSNCIYIFMVNNIINYEVVGITIAEIETIIVSHLLNRGRVEKLHREHFGSVCIYCCLFVENRDNYSELLDFPHNTYKCNELNIYLPHFIKRITKINGKNKIFITYNLYIDSVGVAINNMLLRREVDNVAGVMNIIFDMCRNYILFLKKYMNQKVDFNIPVVKEYYNDICRYARRVSADASSKYRLNLIKLECANPVKKGGNEINAGFEAGVGISADSNLHFICITCAKIRGMKDLVLSNELGGVACKICKTNLFMNSVYFNAVNDGF